MKEREGGAVAVGSLHRCGGDCQVGQRACQHGGGRAPRLGRGGERLKTIASEARRDMEALFGGKVFLDVWVKVKSGWSEDPRSLRQFGFQA